MNNKRVEYIGNSASIVISENLPRRTGLSANAAPGTGFEWTPGGRGQGAGRQELGGRRQERSACLTTGLRSGLLPEGCGVATPEVVKKSPIWGEVFARVLIFGASG